MFLYDYEAPGNVMHLFHFEAPGNVMFSCHYEAPGNVTGVLRHIPRTYIHAQNLCGFQLLEITAPLPLYPTGTKAQWM